MSKHGEDLGVDLYRLWKAGTDNLPSAANVYREAEHFLALTDSVVYSTFSQPDNFDSGYRPGSPVQVPWTALRDTLMKALRVSAENLDLCAAALRLAATTYANADTAAGDKLAAQIRDRPVEASHPDGHSYLR